MKKCVVCSLTYPESRKHWGWNEKLGKLKVTCRLCTMPRMKARPDIRQPTIREHTNPMVIQELKASKIRRLHQEAKDWDQFYTVQGGHTKVGRLGAKYKDLRGMVGQRLGAK